MEVQILYAYGELQLRDISCMNVAGGEGRSGHSFVPQPTLRHSFSFSSFSRYSLGFCTNPLLTTCELNELLSYLH